MMRGLSMVELIVALAIMAMAVSASMLAAITVPGLVAEAHRTADAISIASRTLLSGGDAAEETLEDEHLVRRTELAAWINSNGITRNSELFSIQSTSTEPEACDPFTSGDWAHPHVVGTYSLRSDGLIPSFTGTYSISVLTTLPDTLVVSVASTSRVALPTTFFFALQATSTPRAIGWFDNASTSRLGINSTAVNGRYVYSGNSFGSGSQSTCGDGISCAQIMVFKVGPSSAERRTSLSFATSSPPFAALTDGSSAPTSALTYYRGRLYVGLEKTVQGDEFNILDSSDPSHLQWLSGYRIGRTVTGITVRDDIAYVSTDDPTRELMVFDIRDSRSPALLAIWDAPGSATFGYGSKATVYKNTIRFGRTYSANSPELEVLNLSGTTITETDHLDSGTTKDPESVRGMLTQDRLTFMLLTHRLDVLDTHVLSKATLLGSYQLPPGFQGTSLACRNNQLYVARNGSDGGGVIDVLQGA